MAAQVEPGSFKGGWRAQDDYVVEVGQDTSGGVDSLDGDLRAGQTRMDVWAKTGYCLKIGISILCSRSKKRAIGK